MTTARRGQTWGVVRSLALYYGQPWKTRRLLRLYRQFIAPGDLCFDIGAHVGNRSRAWRRLGARVVAVEPQPHLARLLQRLFGHDPAVTVVPGGVGAAPGTARLLVSTRTPTVTSFSAEWVAQVSRRPDFAHVRWDHAVDVPLTTLDALIARHGVPAFCKIDVEGYERAVLDGLSQPLPALSFEYLAAARAVALACVDRLEQLGRYRYATAPGESQQLGGWQDAAGLRAWLTDLAPDAGSGDIYARLNATPPAQESDHASR